MASPEHLYHAAGKRDSVRQRYRGIPMSKDKTIHARYLREGAGRSAVPSQVVWGSSSPQDEHLSGTESRRRTAA